MKNKTTTHQALKIGARFLLSFEDPSATASPYPGRLQELKPDGSLCLDAPMHFQPRRGTPVTIRSLEPASYSFSSEVVGCHRLGRLPVVQVKPPQRLEQAPLRTAYRVSVCLHASAYWMEGGEQVREPGVVANLSGGGAQVFLRRRPAAQALCLDLVVPDAFVEEAARRQLGGASLPNPVLFKELFGGTCERIRAIFAQLRARIVHAQLHQEDPRGAIHALSISFFAPDEGCFRLVRYLERQAIRKGVHGQENARATPPLARVA